MSQMCVFMTGALCAQRRQCHLVPVAVAILRPQLALIRPCHIAPLVGNGKAALQHTLFPALLNDFRIDRFDSHIAQMHDKKAAAAAHLRCSQSNALRLIQCFVHIIQQCMQILIEHCHRTADGSQHRISHLDDSSQCHAKFLLVIRRYRRSCPQKDVPLHRHDRHRLLSKPHG